MEPEKSAVDEAVAANMVAQAGTRAPVHHGAFRAHKPGPEIGVGLSSDTIAPLIQKFSGEPIAEIEKLIGELQAVRNHLKSEGERIQRETIRYAQLNQTASASVQIISESLREWREAGHPLRAGMAV
jgi:hypothetical protein